MPLGVRTAALGVLLAVAALDASALGVLAAACFDLAAAAALDAAAAFLDGVGAAGASTLGSSTSAGSLAATLFRFDTGLMFFAGVFLAGVFFAGVFLAGVFFAGVAAALVFAELVALGVAAALALPVCFAGVLAGVWAGFFAGFFAEAFGVFGADTLFLLGVLCDFRLSSFLFLRSSSFNWDSSLYREISTENGNKIKVRHTQLP